MTDTPFGIEDDSEVRAALEWFVENDPGRGTLRNRIRAAQEHFAAHCTPVGLEWPDPRDMLLKTDLIASYLAQADAMLSDSRYYDLTLAAHIIPFIKYIGSGVSDLRAIPGAPDRVQRLLKPKQEHPDGALFELAAAIRYAREDFAVEFIAESSAPSADLRAGPPGKEKNLHIECKRLRPSDYELREAVSLKTLFAPLAATIHENRWNIWVDARFKTELAHVPRSYLAEKVGSIMRSPLYLPDGYPWCDEYAEGTLRATRIDAVRADVRANGNLVVGPKMLRLLTGAARQPGGYELVLNAQPHPHDPRYVDEFQYASVLTWECLAPASVEARARHITSLLAKIDRQLELAPFATAHIGMYAERDIVSADRRRELNIRAVQSFSAKSKLIDVYLHYFVPHISEGSSWSIYETAEASSRLESPLLDDYRMLNHGDHHDTAQAAWHLSHAGR